MAYRKEGSPSSASPTPSTSSSVSVSPETNPLPLGTMASDNDSSSQSTKGTPSRSSINLPRTQNASKGGCWTCRVRRKKCDEEREGDSCKTCKRLTIKCLGWGPKRPEWMRDKQAVDNYKAGIKARLTSKGLIRGQPRSNPMHVPSQRGLPYRRQSSGTNVTSSSASSSVPLSHPQNSDYSYHQFEDAPFSHSSNHSHTLLPGLPGASNTSFDQLSTSSYSDASVGGLDPASAGYHYSPSLTSSSSFPLPSDSINHGYPLFSGPSLDQFGYDYLQPPSPQSSLSSGRYAGQSPFQEELVMHYFDQVHKVQFVFAGNKFTDATDRAMVEEPRGAVTFAVCALVDLYATRMRVAQGLEAPNLNPEHSQPMYLRQEAIAHLQGSKVRRGGWRESDAVAAIHLVSFSQLSGGSADWETPFTILCEWLSQTGLHASENPQLTFSNMAAGTQTIIKAILWFDIFISILATRPPSFVVLWKRLLTDGSEYWPGMKMDAMSGCPDEALLCIAEVSALAHWKAIELRNGSLSFPKLIRQGDDIERRLRRNRPPPTDVSLQELMRANVPPTIESAEVFPSNGVRSVVADIFRETAILHLHTVLSNSSPGVPEINASVDAIVHLLYQLPPSDADRALVYPICLAGCMTNDSNLRDFLKGRLQVLDDSIGNLLQTRLLMEAVWQKRDISGGAVDIREVIREQGLNLILI